MDVAPRTHLRNRIRPWLLAVTAVVVCLPGTLTAQSPSTVKDWEEELQNRRQTWRPWPLLMQSFVPFGNESGFKLPFVDDPLDAADPEYLTYEERYLREYVSTGSDVLREGTLKKPKAVIEVTSPTTWAGIQYIQRHGEERRRHLSWPQLLANLHDVYERHLGVEEDHLRRLERLEVLLQQYRNIPCEQHPANSTFFTGWRGMANQYLQLHKRLDEDDRSRFAEPRSFLDSESECRTFHGFAG